jgi:hypothetical protein
MRRPEEKHMPERHHPTSLEEIATRRRRLNNLEENAILVFATAILTAVTLSASTGARGKGDEEAFREARAAFAKAQQGDAGAVDRAHREFARLSEKTPSSPLYRVYLGAATALQARGEREPLAKLDLAEKGLDLIDRALGALSPTHDQAAPGETPPSAEVRLVALATFLGVPEQFHRTEAAREVAAAALASPAFEVARPEVKAGLLFQASVLARRASQREEELALLRRAVAAAGDSPAAGRAQQRLKELSP